jgi:hypothetical protein
MLAGHLTARRKSRIKRVVREGRSGLYSMQSAANREKEQSALTIIAAREGVLDRTDTPDGTNVLVREVPRGERGSSKARQQAAGRRSWRLQQQQPQRQKEGSAMQHKWRYQVCGTTCASRADWGNGRERRGVSRERHRHRGVHRLTTGGRLQGRSNREDFPRQAGRKGG